jgi:hypothetical protein
LARWCRSGACRKVAESRYIAAAFRPSRYHQSPGGEAQDEWHVEWQGSLVTRLPCSHPTGIVYVILID